MSCFSPGINATFDDWGTAAQCSSVSPAISGRVSSYSPLSVFNGQPIVGTWTLTMVDSSPVGSGSILLFAMDVIVKANESQIYSAPVVPAAIPDQGTFVSEKV